MVMQCSANIKTRLFQERVWQELYLTPYYSHEPKYQKQLRILVINDT